MRIEYHPAVAIELEEIRDHYESCSARLGDDFVNEFEQQVLLIAARPERWMIVRDGIRRALMRRFPYQIHFRILPEEAIRITVVKHRKRHPAYGMGRM